MMTSRSEERKLELLRRAGKHPDVVDKRPLNIIMNDEIPYARWERELKVVHRAGYLNWVDLLKDRQDAKDS